MTSNFPRVMSVNCIQGKYPKILLDLWDKYHEERVSQNDRPDIYPGKQFYIAMEFEYAGEDLESFFLESACQGLSLLAQVSGTLAVAESVLQYEHRDLHLGNILVAPIDNDSVELILEGNLIPIPSHGIKATVIDFGLARMSLPGGKILYVDFNSDPALFEGKGDLQFDIYRLMKEQTK
ncbi:unnamed protein product [Darwinula stevensoni]|uniref:Protein kinase domain-containing protein n=1 Tax=Darwinula stevensoni TaxID=69355 RepID=A0A7R9FS23_9CRUS|nr:unnamed protein product [Darwinula stevensoni]CAG0902406.1 unnamed protein product [Darwinula stevensoni]